MHDEDSSDFRIDLNDERPDGDFQDEIGNLRLEKLSQRVTILFILIPCLIGALLVVGYLDIKKRVSGLHDTGVREVQDLSKDFERRLSSLTAQSAKMEAVVEDRFAAVDHQMAAVGVEIKKISSRIETVDARKVDKGIQKTILETVDQKIESLRNPIQQNSRGLKSLDESLTKQVDGLAQEVAHVQETATALQRSISTLKDSQAADMVLLSEGKVDQKRFELQRLETETQFQELKKNVNALNRKLTALETQLESVSRRQAELKPPASEKPDTAPAANSSTPPSPSTSSPSPPVKTPGGIVEQDLR